MGSQRSHSAFDFPIQNEEEPLGEDDKDQNLEHMLHPVENNRRHWHAQHERGQDHRASQVSPPASAQEAVYDGQHRERKDQI